MIRVLLATALLAITIGACSTPPAPPDTLAAPAVPLYEDLGTYHLAITTSSPDAQKYFDQGMRLSYAFNHAEAIRSTPGRGRVTHRRRA